MKKWIFTGTLFIGLSLLSSCGDNTANSSQKTEKVSPKLSNEEAIDAEVKAIDEEIKKADLQANSLSYNKKNGEAIEVIAHLSAEYVILKIEENFSEGIGKNNGTRYYYLKNNFPFVTIESFEDLSNPDAPKYVERVSYYNAKGKALSTKEKRVNYEEELPSVAYKAVPLVPCSIDRAMRVLDQKGEFVTTFQGFLSNDKSLNYLVVGQPGDDSFNSALRVEFNDKFILDALNNEKKYMNRKCRVTFQVSENSGFKYQLYTGGSWIQ